MTAATFSYSNLLQELLLSLLGFPGDVFAADQGSGDALWWKEESAGGATDLPKLTLTRDVEWIEEGDRQRLEELLPLGACCSRLRQFVAAQRDPESARLSYNRALAAGIAELLEVYQAALLQLQRQVVEGADLGLPTIAFYLHDFQGILPVLVEVVTTAEQRADASGAALLRVLQQRAACGVPALQSVMLRLCWHCNQALFRHLSSWMLHGVLLDPEGEFFIAAGAVEGDVPGAGNGLLAGPLEIADPESAGAGAGGDEDRSYREWHQGYRVRPEALPQCVTLETADAVLFVGKAVRVLRQPGGAFRGRDLLQYSDTLAFSEALRRVQQQPLLTSNALSAAVEGIRSKVAAVLWHLAVVSAGLPSHLAALKDYFLLARGDFWQTFLAEAAPLMGAPPRGLAATADVRVPFLQSAAKTSAAGDALFPLVAIRLPQEAPSEGRQGQGAGGAGGGVLGRIAVPEYDRLGWDSLELEYRVEWPLGLLLTPQVLGRYNALFQYLLRLKRVQMQLEGAWKTLCWVTNRNGGATGDGVMARLLQLRHNMAHLVTNLQIYIQVDVIESNHAILVEHIAAAQDFLEAERAHDAHLAALLTQSFLTYNTISQAVARLFALVRRFCDAVAVVEAHGEEGLARLDPRGVEALQAEFVKEVTQLYFVLDSRQLADSNKAPYLRQFHLRLDYNGYIRALKLQPGAL